MYAFSVLEGMPLLPPVNENGVETHEAKNWNAGVLLAPGTGAGERGGCVCCECSGYLQG
jgi:hypothetical protein